MLPLFKLKKYIHEWFDNLANMLNCRFIGFAHDFGYDNTKMITYRNGYHMYEYEQILVRGIEKLIFRYNAGYDKVIKFTNVDNEITISIKNIKTNVKWPNIKRV
jgi:hypothetical protein